MINNTLLQLQEIRKTNPIIWKKVIVAFRKAQKIMLKTELKIRSSYGPILGYINTNRKYSDNAF